MCVCVCVRVFFYVPLQSSSPFCECPRSSQIELHSWDPKYCQHHPKFSMNAISYLDRSTWILETLPFAHLRKHFTFAKTERKSKGNRLQNVDRHRQYLSKDLHEVVGKIQTIHKPRFGASGKFVLGRACRGVCLPSTIQRSNWQTILGVIRKSSPIKNYHPHWV